MKKYIKIALLVVFVTTIYAQKGESAAGMLGEKTRLGFNFNPLFSWCRTPGAQTDNQGVRMGFQIGLQVDYYFAKNYGLSTGVYFSYLGSTINYNMSNTDSLGNPYTNVLKHKYTTQFIELPIGLKLRTNEFKRVTVYGELGVGSMFLLSARGTYMSDFDGINKEQAKVYGTRVNFFDVNVSGGAGIEYNISGKTSIVAGVIYKYAFLNHIKDDKAKDVKPLNLGLAEDPIYLNYFAFRIGVLF